jgi:hypothetical protein
MHLRPYKFTLVQQLYPPDYLQRIQFCNWYKNNLLDNDQQDITFFSAEAWFHLSRFINSYNHRTWSAHNPHNVIQVPLHPFKVAMLRRRIIGPIIYQTVFNVDYSKEVNTLNILFSCICNICIVKFVDYLVIFFFNANVLPF